MKSEQLAMQYWYWAMGIGLLALIVPWIVSRFNLLWAAGIGAVFALTATVLESYSNASMPSNIDIRVDLVFIAPVLFFAWLNSIGLALAGLFRRLRNVSKPGANAAKSPAE